MDVNCAARVQHPRTGSVDLQHPGSGGFHPVSSLDPAKCTTIRRDAKHLPVQSRGVVECLLATARREASMLIRDGLPAKWAGFAIFGRTSWWRWTTVRRRDVPTHFTQHGFRMRRRQTKDFVGRLAGIKPSAILQLVLKGDQPAIALRLIQLEVNGKFSDRKRGL